MDFKTLEYYRKIYEKRSIRQAAAELYISPQGLSRTLYALEEELQVRLFERSVKGLEDVYKRQGGRKPGAYLLPFP